MELKSQYNDPVEKIRLDEYPMMRDGIYLDHGGSTQHAKSLMEHFARDLVSNLYGNPHSGSTPSTLSGEKVDRVREGTLRFFKADPEHFDLVFVANATAAVKLVSDLFRDHSEHSKAIAPWRRSGFRYFYHMDVHTSIAGVREVAEAGHHCFAGDQEVEDWIAGKHFARKKKAAQLFAYCAQSNMTGRRLPLRWTGDVRKSSHTRGTFTLLDAAAFATTGCLDLSDPSTAPDFTCLSFYKIFGFPHLGALIIRKSPEVSELIQHRRYFGGGTVEVVTALEASPLHSKKKTDYHSALEDGTPAYLSIVALGHAIKIFNQLFTNMTCVSQHTAALTKHLWEGMVGFRHTNGRPLVQVYNNDTTVYGDANIQGATIAFNILYPDGSPVAPFEVEKTADKNRIYLRSGRLCNPGGVAQHLGWSAAEIRAMFQSGMRCDLPAGVYKGKPLGAVRVSLGAMSTLEDVDIFLEFLSREYRDKKSVKYDGAESLSPPANESGEDESTVACASRAMSEKDEYPTPGSRRQRILRWCCRA
ncbi:pyridoxal phosphate-dependent transferase [Phyllosticta citribraziliensis]|uniref:Pyridoxal phosphate-dependent transferase n=1 Tax=Phyllosticta citribraziliensis TaxID=989973 RepID=A0ABR1LIT2_9PEZI